MSEEAYLYWLYSVAGLGGRAVRLLVERVGSAAAVYGLPAPELQGLLGGAQIAALLASRERWDVAGEYAKLAAKGIAFLPYHQAGYPEKLLTLADPPTALFVKGRMPSPSQPAVAVIGARKCSGYGSAMAKQLGRELARCGIQVISGMARGVDGIGQRAVCEAGGVTYAVLGSGVDVVYPPENRPLYEMILETGGVISEYLPGASPLSRQFPSRNRIISGLADALVVVEAREKSGTMITVDMALEQGREVYALPGRLVDPLSVGCNHLIRQGATPIVDIAEFCEEFLAAAAQRLAGRGLEGARAMATVKKKRKAVPPAQPARAAPLPKKRGFSAEEEEVLAALDYTPCPLERIASACPRVPYDRLLKILVTFCLKGHARQMGAGNYCLMDE